jgi:CRISPR system Cascade subunit CasA
MAYDFLTEPLIETREEEKPAHLTLPGLLAEWASGRDVVLEGIRPHQRAGMHMFLVQIAVGALCLSGSGEALDVGEDGWRVRLLALAPPLAWHLIAGSENDPALMQPSVPVKHLADFKDVANPDGLSVLVASKNHCLKQNVISFGSPWQWLCALVELQTLSGYSGKFNYGIIRMNGGMGSRPLVAVYPDMREGARWQRDVSRYHEALKAGLVPDGFSGSATEGLVATWSRPWDGVEQIPMTDLHPAFVEVARRVRLLTSASGSISAVVGNSKLPRIDAPKELCGRTGDPWAPMDGDEKILTVSADGWSLRRLRNLIVSGYTRPLLQEFGNSPDRERDFFVYASVITGGQGKTEGFHEVTIPVPGRIVVRLSTTLEARPRLGILSTEMVDDADKASSALRRALVTFLRGGVPPTDKVDRKEADVWIGRLQAAVKDAFFPMLWSAMDAPNRGEWRSLLRHQAEGLYDEAARALPTRQELFYRAYDKGKGVLIGKLKQDFSDTPPPKAARKAAA